MSAGSGRSPNPLPGRSFAGRPVPAFADDGKPAGRNRAGQERAVESRGAQRDVVADRRRRQARAHRVRRRQAVHDRLQPRRWQRSLAGPRAGQGDRAVSQDRRQPGRFDAGDRRRADRLVLRLVRPVLLRPGGQRTVAARNAARRRRWPTSARACRRSSPTARSCCCATNQSIPKIVALDAATGKPKWEKKRQSKSGFGTPAVWETPGRQANRRPRLRPDDRLRPCKPARKFGRSTACRRRPARRP